MFSSTISHTHPVPRPPSPGFDIILDSDHVRGEGDGAGLGEVSHECSGDGGAAGRAVRWRGGGGEADVLVEAGGARALLPDRDRGWRPRVEGHQPKVRKGRPLSWLGLQCV